MAKSSLGIISEGNLVTYGAIPSFLKVKIKKESTVYCPSLPPQRATEPFFKTHEANPDSPLDSRQSVGINFMSLTLNSPISSMGTPNSSFPPITARESSDIGKT